MKLRCRQALREEVAQRTARKDKAAARKGCAEPPKGCHLALLEAAELKEVQNAQKENQVLCFICRKCW